MASNRARVPDQASPIHRLAIKPLFDSLPPRDKLYAHYLSQAAWHGARIILRQTSSESEDIFDFIIRAYRACEGDWSQFEGVCAVTDDEVKTFLSYAGLFLYNLGNFYGEGGQKFVPDLSKESLEKIVGCVGMTEPAAENLVEAMTAVHPQGLGYPSDTAVSSYYLGDRITRTEIKEIQLTMQEKGYEPENTRVRKRTEHGSAVYEVLRASYDLGSHDLTAVERLGGSEVTLMKGDHRNQVSNIGHYLGRASMYAQNDNQVKTLERYIYSLVTGCLGAYRQGQETWVKDVAPSIEHILGFVECYRDPHGVRAEWEGVVCIADPEETKKMEAFVSSAGKFCTLLPRATVENEGKGLFEKDVVFIPQCAIVHALTVCCPYVWEASNLPNYNDIREKHGSKNIIIANRMSANRNSPGASIYLHASDRDLYRQNLHTIRFVATVIHELLGHGTGKLLSETAPGIFNFDATNPPISPLTGRNVESWYRPNETYSSIFEDIAQSVEECRAILMSAYLIDNKEILGIFGYNEGSVLTADNLVFLFYLHLGVEGLRSLEHYNPDDKKWTQAHSQGYFAIFKQLLIEGDGVITVHHDANTSNLHVTVDRSKILSHGKPALGRMMCNLHIWRCTADVEACRPFYESLTNVEGVYEVWRQVVATRPERRMKFVQGNTSLVYTVEGGAECKEYEESDEGIIQSWADREV
ncbi:hypothetical protein J4E83_006461 [Alternaria metachromatica]|uniref:uncharacterized protein n=1 Tax=Alternaria metachromatica TaxID=283354 RepID=UPI0020C225C6|nr:uncharacterized protein J4E83_006461 [Alternaria metachromatica]KAI4616879.1 hypothetical protein J4E83_006461 [Alternaria metachromatica]